MRQFLGLALGGTDIRDEAERVTADGRRMPLVLMAVVWGLVAVPPLIPTR